MYGIRFSDLATNGEHRLSPEMSKASTNPGGRDEWEALVQKRYPEADFRQVNRSGITVDPVYSSSDVERRGLEEPPLPGLFPDDTSLENMVDRIILGPSQTSGLALPTVARMLTQAGMEPLAGRVWASTTPFRAI